MREAPVRTTPVRCRSPETIGGRYTLHIVLLLLALCVGGTRTARAQYIPVYGGPAFDPASGDGFRDYTVPPDQLGVNNAGTAVGYAHKLVDNADKGTRAVRWGIGGTSTDLGDLGTDGSGKTFAHALSINNASTTVGSAVKYNGTASLGFRAVRWEAGSATPIQLGDLGTSKSGVGFSVANDVNAGGTAVGATDKFSSNSVDIGSRAVRWDSGSTTATELGGLGTSLDGGRAVATALNDGGTIVGYAYVASQQPVVGTRAVRWNPGTTAAVELGNLGTDLSGNTKSAARDVNAAGTIIGYAEKFGIGMHEGAPVSVSLGLRPVRWDAGSTTATELGNLGADPAGMVDAGAVALNEGGTIVGYADKYSGTVDMGWRPVRWDAGSTTPTELEILGTDGNGWTRDLARGINSRGIAVGMSRAYDQDHTYLGERAVLWLPDTSVLDLNALVDPASGWTLTEAYSISDTNFIAGVGYFDPDGSGPAAAYNRSFVLDVSSVVPEPGSLILLSIALLPAALRRTRGTRAHC